MFLVNLLLLVSYYLWIVGVGLEGIIRDFESIPDKTTQNIFHYGVN